MGEQSDVALSVVSDGTEYSLSAAPDGSRYILRFKAESMTADITGEDAERFQKDYDEVKSQFPDANADQLLAQLWDQGGYSWLAVQDE